MYCTRTHISRHQVNLRLKRSQSKPSPARCGSEGETLCLRHFHYSVTSVTGGRAGCVSYPVVRLFRASHLSILPFTYLLLVPYFPSIHLSCIVPLQSSYPILPSLTICIPRSLLLPNRLHHPFRGLRRHATPRPRFAALQHPISWY
jgi:hypothetical protein